MFGKFSIRKLAFGAVAASIAISVGFHSVEASAQAQNIREEARVKFDKAIKGKKVAWVPIWMGNLETEWTKVMKMHFDKYGIQLITRDPNFNNDVQLQAVSELINEKPDILIVQNNSTTLLVNELKRATAAGIYVIQVNMSSNFTGDAYVGVDWVEIGREIGGELVKACGGGKSSGKVELIQGEATAAGSVDQLKGALEVLKADPTIKVVSTQPGNWDANKANQVATTVLQQHPDLCAIHSFWGPMTAGAAQAVKNAGKQGKVKVFGSSDGQMGDCELVEQGLAQKNLSYRADLQGEAIVNAALTLLQEKNKPGSKALYYFSNEFWVTSKNEHSYCYPIANK